MLLRVTTLKRIKQNKPKTPHNSLGKTLLDTALFLGSSLGHYYFINEMHSERRGRPCVVLRGFSLEDRIEPGTWAAGTSPLWLLYSLQTEYFVCTHIVFLFFFFLSLSPPGWPKTHQVAGDDFELLILLLPPPVLGWGCVQPCLVLWAAGESKRGLGACQVHTPNNGDKAPACVYASEPDSGVTVSGLPRPHPWVSPLTGSRWGKLRRLKSLTQIKTRERIKTL